MGTPSMWRKADILADATYEILMHPELSNGRADRRGFPAEVGYTDFDAYRCDPEGEPLELSSAVMRAAQS